MLSGSLSTHNGSGGGNINVTVRRVTSAKGWGEPIICNFSVQLPHRPVWSAVLASRTAAELFSDDGAPPGPEHDGLPSVALGAQQRHDYQPGPRHEEYPLYFSSA
ncbi:hypothetical protein GOODEAATRI_032170, partial [Goodea atripinnis]